MCLLLRKWTDFLTFKSHIFHSGPVCSDEGRSLSEMPNSDTWPRAVSVETVSNMDSAHSSDSVISVHSACSEDSMEHLSAEEKACLMYLEETIESLDLQEDSGFSNDEPDSAIRRIKQGGSEASPQPEIDSNILTVLTESGLSSETESPNSQSLLTSSSSTPDISDPDLPSHIPPDPTPVPGSVSGSTTPVPVPVPDTDSDLQTTAAKSGLSAKGDTDLSVIPPPSDFMDEPVHPLAQKDDETSATSAPANKTTINLEVLRRRVSEKNIPVSGLSASANPISPSPTTEELFPISPIPAAPISISPTPPSSTIDTPVSVSPIPEPTSESPDNLDDNEQTSMPSSLQTPALSGDTEPKTPPAVAPKPKKLPPNIILKSHKSIAVHENIMGHPSGSDRLIMDPQKVRMEALRKLGLLKSEESNSETALSPRPLQSRKSWAPASSPLSPVSPKTPPPSAPYTVTSHVRSEPLPDIIPVPAAFSDPLSPLNEDVFIALNDQGSPALQKKLLSFPEEGAVKSATLERSGLGLSSYMESMDMKQQSLNQLRNSRPRPASLGSGKDFAGDRHVPAPSHSNSQKLPRSVGISVVISPGEQGEAARRQALKKLGLLRE